MSINSTNNLFPLPSILNKFLDQTDPNLQGIFSKTLSFLGSQDRAILQTTSKAFHDAITNTPVQEAYDYYRSTQDEEMTQAPPLQSVSSSADEAPTDAICGKRPVAEESIERPAKKTKTENTAAGLSETEETGMCEASSSNIQAEIDAACQGLDLFLEKNEREWILDQPSKPIGNLSRDFKKWTLPEKIRMKQFVHSLKNLKLIRFFQRLIKANPILQNLISENSPLKITQTLPTSGGSEQQFELLATNSEHIRKWMRENSSTLKKAQYITPSVLTGIFEDSEDSESTNALPEEIKFFQMTPKIPLLLPMAFRWHAFDLIRDLLKNEEYKAELRDQFLSIWDTTILDDDWLLMQQLMTNEEWHQNHQHFPTHVGARLLDITLDTLNQSNLPLFKTLTSSPFFAQISAAHFYQSLENLIEDSDDSYAKEIKIFTETPNFTALSLPLFTTLLKKAVGEQKPQMIEMLLASEKIQDLSDDQIASILQEIHFLYDCKEDLQSLCLLINHPKFSPHFLPLIFTRLFLKMCKEIPSPEATKYFVNRPEFAQISPKDFKEGFLTCMQHGSDTGINMLIASPQFQQFEEKDLVEGIQLSATMPLYDDASRSWVLKKLLTSAKGATISKESFLEGLKTFSQRAFSNCVTTLLFVQKSKEFLPEELGEVLRNVGQARVQDLNPMWGNSSQSHRTVLFNQWLGNIKGIFTLILQNPRAAQIPQSDLKAIIDRVLTDAELESTLKTLLEAPIIWSALTPTQLGQILSKAIQTNNASLVQKVLSSNRLTDIPPFALQSVCFWYQQKRLKQKIQSTPLPELQNLATRIGQSLQAASASSASSSRRLTGGGAVGEGTSR